MADENTGSADEKKLDPAVEQEARSQGWVPLEEFRDDQAKWVDADTFVQRGREINPILRKHNAELKRELEKTKKQAQEAIDAAKEFREFQRENYERKQLELESQITALKAAKKEAISQGDGERAVAIDDAIDTIREEKADLKKPAPKTDEIKDAVEELDPTLQAWVETNPWYGKDTEESAELTEITNGIAVSIRRQNPNLIGEAFLKKLDERLESRGIKPKRTKPEPVVEGGSGGDNQPTPVGKRTYTNLPPDAKAACDKFVKQNLMTREQYLAEYDWD